jgi:CDP-diacylglycerol--serine O-phosphatidyltransferase
MIRNRNNGRHRFRRLRMPRRRTRAIAVLPTLFTLGNLVAGFAALHYASRDPSARVIWGWTPLTLAGTLIFVGMFLDAVDGSIARLTRSFSEIGKQLDSLADMVTFGIAPAFLVLRLVQAPAGDAGVTIIGPEADDVLGRIVWAAAALYVCCAGLRLARYNAEAVAGGAGDTAMFRGLPSPGAAGAIASLVILHQHLLATPPMSEDVSIGFVRSAAFGVPFVALLCAIAMVSSIPYIHFTNRFVRGRRTPDYIVRAVVLIILAITAFQWTMAIAFTAYALSGPVRLGAKWLRARVGRPGETVPTTVPAPSEEPSESIR